MTTYPLGKLQLNKPETISHGTLRFVALLTLVVLVGALLFSVMNAALPALGEMRIQSAVNALGDDRLTTQRHAAQSELENTGEGAVPALIVALGAENTTLRQNAADMLGFIASPQSQLALRDTVRNDPALQVRRNAAWALGEIPDAAALNTLTQVAVLDRDTSVRQTATHSIARIRTRLALTAGINEQALSAFAVAPGNVNTVYLATRRDLVSSHDSGKTWTTLANVLPSLLTTLAISPQDEQFLYASVDGLGFYTSADGGATWMARNSGLQLLSGTRYGATAIAFDPADSRRLFIATGVWLGTGKIEFYPLDVMSSDDSGTTWHLYHKTTNALPITQLALKGTRLYALTGEQVVMY